MGKIKILHEKDLKLAPDSNDTVYPVTSAKAVYTTDNKKVQNVLDGLKESNASTDAALQNLKDKVDNVLSGINNVFLEETEEDTALYHYTKDTMYYIYEPIVYTLVDKPINMTLYYDGTLHTLPPDNAYQITGTGGIDIGTYTFVVKLNATFKWSDGTRDDLTITYSILEKPEEAWKFGDTFPIRFTEMWYFNGKFPITFL